MKKQNIIIVLLLAIVLAFTNITLLLTQNQANAITDNTSLDSICKSYTETENPNVMNVDAYVQDFLRKTRSTLADTTSISPPGSIAKGTYFQNGCSYLGEASPNYDMSISADDNIVKIIPKELFQYNVQKLYIGKKYGFYITTRPISENQISYSTVVLFTSTSDININKTMSFSCKLCP